MSEKKIAMFTFAAKMCKTVSALVCEERLCFIVMVVTAVAERGVVLCTTERAPEQAGKQADGRIGHSARLVLRSPPTTDHRGVVISGSTINFHD